MFLYYCRYPTSDMYEDIVDGIVSEYPYLLTYQKMDLTFAHRRKMIVKEKIEMKNLLEIFPWLHLRHEVSDRVVH